MDADVSAVAERTRKARCAMDDIDQLIEAFGSRGKSDHSAWKLDILMDLGRFRSPKAVAFCVGVVADGDEPPDVRADALRRLREATLTPAELANAIALQDRAAVSRAPGVGPKVAMRIVTELKNKAPAFAGDAANIALKQELGEGVAAAPVADAVSALTNLGYSRDQAANAVAAAIKAAGEGADSAKLIRLGLKELAR